VAADYIVIPEQNNFPGFDGVFLDMVDAYWELSDPPYYDSNARANMENFVKYLSNYAKSKRPGFKIIANNAQDLVFKENSTTLNTEYLNAIDGLARESMFFANGRRRTDTQINYDLQYLNAFKNNGKMVFTIDYPSTVTDIQWDINKSAAAGFIPFCGNEALDRMVTYY